MFKVVFPYMKTPWKFSVAVLPNLGTEIDDILDTLSGNVYSKRLTPLSEFSTPEGKVPLERPNRHNWVLIDLRANYIIHRLFLEILVVDDGEYMVLPMCSSVVSDKEFGANKMVEEMSKLLDSTRPEVPNVSIRGTIRLKFPSHDMFFEVPLKLGEQTGIKTVINKIITDINANRLATPRRTEQATGCPNTSDWIAMNSERTEIISKSLLERTVGDYNEYIILPIGALEYSGEDLDREIKNARLNYRAKPKPLPKPQF